MDDYVTTAVHAEFARRIEAEEARQNKRLEVAEGKIEELQRMSAAIEKLAVNMDVMAKEQTKMVSRLDAIEAEPAEKWKKAVWVIVVAIISAAVAFILRGVGL